MRVGESRARVSVSLGVAELDGSCSSPDALLERADLAMYAAKRGGRNQVGVWPKAHVTSEIGSTNRPALTQPRRPAGRGA